MGPQFVAPTSAITQEAQALRGGLGTFAPFLQTAATQAGQAGQFVGSTSLSTIYVSISTRCY
jgi:hypothetical protein